MMHQNDTSGWWYERNEQLHSTHIMIRPALMYADAPTVKHKYDSTLFNASHM